MVLSLAVWYGDCDGIKASGSGHIYIDSRATKTRECEWVREGDRGKRSVASRSRNA